MTPQPTEVVIDPHIVCAICCLAVAFVVALFVALVPIEDDPERRRRNRR